jgi:hypothetical protein
MLHVPLHEIVLATGHHQLDIELVATLAVDLVDSDEFETLPVTVGPSPDGRLVLLDGRHRFAANLIAGRPVMPAVFDG